MYSLKYTLKCPSRSFQPILVRTRRFVQKAIVVFKINLSGISMHQIVYSANLE